MAVVQISRIQHRRGVSSNLPQLSSGELGWVFDQRKLYIGNGTLAEGAPLIGNTEILTELSLTSISSDSSYTYAGEHGGYTVDTSPGSAAIVRTQQLKFDEVASVLDFGATGDGSTDDTAAINQALAQLFTVDATEPLTRRALFFPAGRYIVTSSLKVPPYAILFGDGIDSTIIQSGTGAQDVVLRTADSLQQTGGSIGTSGAIAPQFITIKDMTIRRTAQSASTDVVIVDRSTDVNFSRVKFESLVATAVSPDASRANVRLLADSTFNTKRIYFTHCVFSNGYEGITVGDDPINHIVLDSCYFNVLSRGISEFATTEDALNVRIMNSHFENIFNSGIYAVNNVRGWVGLNNTFTDVGDENVPGAGTYPVIDVSGSNNQFSGSYFQNRNDEQTNYQIAFEQPTSGVLGADYRSDLHVQTSGRSVTVRDNINGVSVLGLQFPSGIQNYEVIYSIVRDTNSRHGVMKITHDNTTVVYDDDYVEQGTTNVILAADIIGNTSFNAATEINTTTNAITSTNHALVSGQRVVYNNGGNSDIAGLTNNQVYFVTVINVNEFRVADGYDDSITDLNPVNITAVGSGTHSFDASGSSVLYDSGSTGNTGVMKFSVRLLD